MCCCSCLFVWSCALANCNIDCPTESKVFSRADVSQCYLRSLHYYRSHWSRGSLKTGWSLSTRSSRGFSISRGSFTIRGSSITIRGSSTIRSPPPGYPPLPGGLPFLLGYPLPGGPLSEYLPQSGGLPH